jgi:CBS domain-containing protein
MYEFLEYRVADVMTRQPVTITRKTSLAEVERLFEAHDFNALPVVGSERRLLGIVTKLDFLKAFAFTPQAIVPPYEEIMGWTADRVMSPAALTVSPDAPLTRILETMVATRHKSFPVVEEDRLVGIVAREDVARAVRLAAAGRGPVRTGS